jgi:hypothetical protein
VIFVGEPVSLASATLSLAAAGAAVSWVVAFIYFLRTLAAIGPEDRSLRWRAMVAWPFAVRQLKGTAAGHAAVVNKAIVAFVLCVFAMLATVAIMSNVERLAK